MKKLIIMSLVSLSLSPSFAQIEKGTWLLGGKFSIVANSNKHDDAIDSTSDTYNSKTSEIRIGPEAAYFLADNFAVSFLIGFNHTVSNRFQLDKHNDQISLKDIDNGVWVSPDVAYFWPLGEKKKAGLFAGAAFSFIHSKEQAESYSFTDDNITKNDGDKVNTIVLAAYPGVFYRPTDCLLFQFGFSGFGFDYEHSTTKHTNDTKEKVSSVSIGGSLQDLWIVNNTVVAVYFVFK